MDLIQYFLSLKLPLTSLAKNTEQADVFAKQLGAYSMYQDGYGLNIPTNISAENQIRTLFSETLKANGKILFCINDVDLIVALKGFTSFIEATENFQITEWELFYILTNEDILEVTLFHNRKNLFKYDQHTKQFIWPI